MTISTRRSPWRKLQSLARAEYRESVRAGELAAARAAELRALGARLGLLQIEPETFLRKQPLKSPASVGQAGGGETLQPARGRVDRCDIERLIGERAQPARRRTSRSPTASATRSRRRACCSRTSRAVRRCGAGLTVSGCKMCKIHVQRILHILQT